MIFLLVLFVDLKKKDKYVIIKTQASLGRFIKGTSKGAGMSLCERKGKSQKNMAGLMVLE